MILKSMASPSFVSVPLSYAARVSRKGFGVSHHNSSAYASSFITGASLHVSLAHGRQTLRGHQRSSDSIRMELSGVEHSSLKVLVIGSGGREHALVESFSRSSYLSELLVAPGNAGISAMCECVPEVSADDVEGIVKLAISRDVSFVIVGPEAPLVRGVVDRLKEAGILAFGPTAAAAELEGSKVFTKCFLERHEIPTAEFAAFADLEFAQAYTRELGMPLVIKASGLAAGKGVVLSDTLDNALSTVEDMLQLKSFGRAGEEVIIERRLYGEELSFFAIIDGDTAIPLASAQDHKKAHDGDEGLNTGGMGAYSPSPLCDDAMVEAIMTRVVRPTMKGMREEENPFAGILYCGLMVDPETRDFSVLEFNVRFGDPECQVLCARLKSDMLELLYRAANGQLGDKDFSLEWDPRPALTVVMATTGYPEFYEKGSVIRGIDNANAIDGVTVYHAGTAVNDDGDIIANGGRVLGVTAIASSIREAQHKAYKAVDVIDWPQGFCRRDIGRRAVVRDEKNAFSGTL